jgi:hypothetical protein
MTHLQVAILGLIEFNTIVLNINPKKFKEIRNKSIPNPLRPKFRKKAQSNIYFLSQRKVTNEKRNLLIKRVKIATIVTIVLASGYFLSN